MRRSNNQDPELDRLAQRPPQQICKIGDERADVSRFRIERLSPAEGEQLSSELRAILRRVVSLFGELALLGIAETRGEHFQIGDDRRQEVVEIVRDAAGELADRLHLLRLAKLVFDLLAAGEVADEAGEDPLSVRARFADRQFHRENCAVLGLAFDQPAVADDPRFAGPEIIADVAVMLDPVGFGHQHPDVASDDFFGAVAEQLCRRGAERNVPGPARR